MVCLGIPVPRCVQELLREPPICFPRGEDAEILGNIEEFGRDLGRPEDEINQACSLASGPSDLIIILERPHEKQKYDVAFDRFIRECPTLKAVDELIRFGSNGARSIHTVTVLDAFSFAPDKGDLKTTKRCHELIERILRRKRPRVVVCCWKGECENVFVSQFMSRGVGTWPILHTAEIETSSTALVRSFHPSTVVNFRKLSPYSRMLLICHFVLAFAKLGGCNKLPRGIEIVCHRSAKLVSLCLLARLILRDDFRESNDYNIFDERKATITILSLLRRATAEVQQPRGTVPGFKDVPITRERDDVGYLLRRLFYSDYSRGAIDIAHLCLIWVNYDHPSKDDVLARLREIGSRQPGFLLDPPSQCVYALYGFDDDDSEVPLEKPMGSLTLSESSATSTNIVQADIDEGNALLRRLQTRYSNEKTCLEGFEQTATTLSSRVHAYINLRINTRSADRIELSGSIAKLAHNGCSRLFEATSLVYAAPAILAGNVALSREEDPLKQSLLGRHDGRDILDRIIDDVEPLVDIGFRFSLLLSGLLPQGKLLLPRTANLADDSETLIELPTGNLQELVEQLHYGLINLFALRKQLDSDATIVAVKYHTPPFADMEEGVRGVYKIRMRVLH